MIHMIHIAAISQIRLDTEGRTYYRRKRAEGKKPLEAIRCLKRWISDAIYRQLLADNAAQEPRAGPGGHCGATQESSAVDLSPHIDTVSPVLAQGSDTASGAGDGGRGTDDTGCRTDPRHGPPGPEVAYPTRSPSRRPSSV